MNSLLTSTNSAVTLAPDNELGIIVKDIQFAIPPTSATTSSGYLTVSGSYTGSTIFANNVSPNLKFAYNETVTLTATNLGTNFMCNVHWINYGDQTAYTELARRTNTAMYIPARLRDR